MSDRGVFVSETCSCGAEIDVTSATGWLDSLNVQEQLRVWRDSHRHLDTGISGPTISEAGELSDE